MGKGFRRRVLLAQELDERMDRAAQYAVGGAGVSDPRAAERRAADLMRGHPDHPRVVAARQRVRQARAAGGAGMMSTDAARMINLLVEQGHLVPLRDADVGNLFTTSREVLAERERLLGAAERAAELLRDRVAAD